MVAMSCLENLVERIASRSKNGGAVPVESRVRTYDTEPNPSGALVSILEAVVPPTEVEVAILTCGQWAAYSGVLGRRIRAHSGGGRLCGRRGRVGAAGAGTGPRTRGRIWSALTQLLIAECCSRRKPCGQWGGVFRAYSGAFGRRAAVRAVRPCGRSKRRHGPRPNAVASAR